MNIMDSIRGFKIRMILEYALHAYFYKSSNFRNFQFESVLLKRIDPSGILF